MKGKLIALLVIAFVGIILKAENAGCSLNYVLSSSTNPTGNWYIISPQNDFNVGELDNECGIYSQAFYFDTDDRLKVKNRGTLSKAEIAGSGGLLVKVESKGCWM